MPRTAMSKYPLLAVVGITALSLAACGSSTTGSPTTSSKAGGSTSPTTSAPGSTSPTPSAQGKDHVAGLIASVSGSTIRVTQSNGTAAVDYSQSTRISELTPAQLTDVTPGTCVSVRPAGGGAQNGGTVTARAVLVSPATNGQCRQPGGRGARGGTVSSVTGNTIVAGTTDASGNTSQTTIQVGATTTYAKRGVANPQAIAQGKCIAARGTDDNSGTLQATSINLRPATNGRCPQPNGNRHHTGG